MFRRSTPDLLPRLKRTYFRHNESVVILLLDSLYNLKIVNVVIRVGLLGT
jgi:hypothetical protein